MNLTLWKKVLIGMLIGIISGYFFPQYYLLAKPFAIIYTNLIKMMIIPTVFSAILFGMTNIRDIHTLGRIGIKSIIIYFFVTILAVTIGITSAHYFAPGIDSFALCNFMNINNFSPITTIEEIIIGMFPSNPIFAMANGNTLQVVVFALIVGLSIVLVGDKADDLRKVIVSTTNVLFKTIELILKLTPYGVFFIMVWIIGEYGFTLILHLSKLMLVIMYAFTIQYLFFGLILLLFKLNPIHFYKKTFNIQSVAFATSSSKATISTAIKDLQDKLGVSKKIAGFILPLGTAINMTGSAIYIAICALFFAQITGMHLTTYQYIILIVTSTIGSIGAAGCPSGGVIMLTMVLHSIGLPVDGVSMIMGIDRFVDMFRTVINVTGDCAVTVITDKMENSLNMKIYNDCNIK